MALAAVLLVSGGLAVGGAVLLKTRGETRHATWAGIAAAAFFVAAIAVFVGRPDGEVSLATAGLAGGNSSDTAAPAAPSGHLPCRFVPETSRATVPNTGDVAIDRTPHAYVNGRTAPPRRGATDQPRHAEDRRG